MKRTGIFTILLFTFLIGQTEDDYYEVKLTMNPPEFGQFFGGQLSVDGDLAAISGGFAIHYYRLLDGEWIEFQSMTSDDTPYELPVDEISLYDSTIAYCLGGGGFLPYEANRIYINRFDGEFWQRDTVITIDDMADTSLTEFGNNLKLVGNKLLVMGRTLTTSRVYLLEKLNDVWNVVAWVEKEMSQYFGFSLAMNENIICIGADGYDGEYEQSGIVYCYQYEDSDMIEIARIYSSNQGYHYRFGGEVLLYDEYLFVGENGDINTPDFSGTVHVYFHEDTTLYHIAQIMQNDAEGADFFGYNIEANENQLLISSEKSDDGGPGSGSVYLFEKETDEIGNVTWYEKKKIISSDLALGDGFGARIGLTENYIMVGAPAKDNFSGAVYVYDPNDTTLHANFAGDVRTGNAPVTVQFTAVPQGNPTAYEWDFNSDGFIDSTEPNPQFTYFIDGVYTVTLTVYDETGSDVEVKTDYIRVVSDILFGDVNSDGYLNVSDLVMYIDFILGYSEPEEDQFLAGDVNYSGQIDIIDIVMVIDEILGMD